MNPSPMNPDMDADPNQDLSALLDGELDPDRRRFLLQRLGHDDELRQRWARWQLVSSCMKGEFVRPLPADFSERVLASLDVEPLQRAQSNQGSHNLRWIGGVAVAASIGLAAVLWRPAATPQQSVADTTSVPAHVAIQPLRIPLPEPPLQLAIKLPIPVHEGVVSAYRSPLHPVAVSRRSRSAHFSPLPQPYAIDPMLEAYLAQQKSAAGAGSRDSVERDVFSEHNVYLPTRNDTPMGTVSWSPDDSR